MNAVLKTVPRKRREYVTVHIDEEVSVPIDTVLEECTDEQLREELDRRSAGQPPRSLLAVYEEFARRGDAPQVLKDFIYDTLGRVL
jgi:hypothetical protein